MSPDAAGVALAYVLGVLAVLYSPAWLRERLIRAGRSWVAAACVAGLAAWIGHAGYSLAPPLISKMAVARAGAEALGMRLWELAVLGQPRSLFWLGPHEGASVIPEAVRAAKDLGIFGVISGVQRTAEEVAKMTNITVHGARCVLEVLSLAGFVARDQATGAFSHNWTAASLQYLHVMSDFWAVVERPMVAHLTEAVRTGRAAGLARVYGDRFPSLYHARTEVPELVAWTNFMDHSTRMTMAAVLAELGATHYGRFRVLLDVCGNEGTNAITLARRYPQLQVTVHDLPAVIEDPHRGTRLRIRQAGLDDRVAVFGKDLTSAQTSWPSSTFDAVQLVHCVNEWRAEELRSRLRELLGVLTPGGTLLIIGSFPSAAAASGAGDAGDETAWVNFQMPYFLAATQDGGTLHTVEELEAALRAAGFVETRALPLAWTSSAIIGRRPPAGQ